MAHPNPIDESFKRTMDLVRRWQGNAVDIRRMSDEDIAASVIKIGSTVEDHKKWFYSFEIGEPMSTEGQESDAIMSPGGRGCSYEDLKRMGLVGLYARPETDPEAAAMAKAV